MANVRPEFKVDFANESYTDAEWKLKSQWYIDKLNEVENMLQNVHNTGDLVVACKAMEALLNVVRLDKIYVTQSKERYEQIRKEEEKKCYNIVQQQYEQAGKKATVDTIKGEVMTYLATKPYANTGIPLVNIVMTTNARSIFVDGILDSLEDKRNLVISFQSIFKTENTMSMGGSQT